MRIIRRLRSALVIPALALLPLAGCFDTANPSELSCTQGKYCPDGYVCVGAQTGSPGKCQKPADAGRSDAMVVTDSAGNIDSRAYADTWADGSVPPNDGPTTNTDTPAAIDQSPSPDISNEQDTASDLPASADFGRDVPSDAPISPPDTPADTALPVPDLGPDQKLQGPDVAPDLSPDLAYVPEVGLDVPPTSCVIGGTSYANGAANPTNACQICKAATSSSGWSNADEGTSCNGSQYCNSGACKAGCFISGAYYANGAANPANACQTCQTTFATTSWTARTSGESCATGQVCSGGTCQSGCWIEGALIGSGTTNSSNVCQVCKPATSTSGWSNNTDGTSCGSGRICGTGACQAGCYAGGAVYAAGALNPANGCQSCNPSISTSAWYQVPSDCATIAAHGNFTCATTGGAVKCWGTNSDGNLGQSYGQVPSSALPLAIATLSAGVQAIATGVSSHACALVGGGVKCWGRNDFGQLGNGTTTNAYVPVQVTGLASGVLGVATGESYSCALLNGEVRCWGINTHGQLGISGSQAATTPVGVALSGNIQAITVGGEHSCALVDSTVWCWGSNSNGQLGNNSTTDSYIPVQATGLGSNVQAIAAGSAQTCAITNGSLLCWGDNSYGEVGDGTTTDRWAPVQVQGLSGTVQAVANATYRTCAIVNSGAWCWGWNLNGELGDNSTTTRLSPVVVQGLGSGVQAITAGYSHSCALTNAGAKCWGDNSYGELGNNSTTNSLTPVPVQGL